MKFKNNYVIIFTFYYFFLINVTTHGDTDNNTLSRETTITKNFAPLKKSDLCTKCTCDLANNLIDCTRNLNSLLSKEEWDVLMDGDFVLETIKLDHNNISKIPILQTYAVKNLYLGNNQIDSIAIGAFQNLSEMTSLDLSHNKLTSKVLLPDVFRGPYTVTDFKALYNLKSLNLGHNDLHFLDADLFEHVPNLEELILCSNNFQIINGVSEVAISGLASLKILDISYMQLKILPQTILHGPRDLETFIAAGNLFSKLPKALTYAKNLASLVLNENPIEDLQGDNIFPMMTNLKYLSMSYMPKLRHVGVGAMSELQNLTELILSDNKFLVEIDELALAKNLSDGQYMNYPPLEKIYLNNCNLTAIPRSLLVRWDKLGVLDLRFNPWNCDESNDYLINILLPQINKTTPILAKNVECSSPPVLQNVAVLKVATDRLIDNNSSSSIFWIGLLVFIFIGFPITLGIIVLYRRGCFYLNKNDSVTSHALYNRAKFNDDFQI
ncbi:insulin-like growth factor-binding protein complex acid labile subunit [Drosophila obscura]|uniref:insulin-like growth factor-binding protein complex acid labile subunit n=1 Tax=Drosophila obscura TaxID=7282 RepID=UPI001BB0FB78|nr:insulin-like growth factor-binding protein complex acid labile subunit [Drosophila obscura]